MSGRLRHTRPLALVVAAGVLAACGTTVQVDGAPAQSSGGSLDSGAILPPGAADPGGSLDAPDGGTLPDVSAGGTDGGLPAAPDGTTSGGGPQGGDADPTTDPTTPGDDPFEDTPAGGTVKVGIAYTGDGTEANAAIGAGFATGDEKSSNQALIDELNEAGGINGREVEPVYFAYSAVTSQTAASQDQAACAAFTEDEHVAFVLGGGLTDTLDACLLKAGAIHINSGTIINWDQAMLDQYPSHIVLGTMTQDRMMAGLVESLKRSDYFASWSPRTGVPAATKLGVLAVDLPQWRRPVDSVLLPALARAGHPVDPSNVIYIRNATSTAGAGTTAADVNNAVLRLAASGVTHVVDLDGSALLTIFFAQAASSQGYYPRLGITSGTGAQALRDQGVVGARTFKGAVGMGWLPNLDVRASEGEKLLTPAADRCLKVLRERTGQQFGTANEAGIALANCDAVWTMAAALEKAGDQLSFAGVRAALDSLGGTPQPALIPKSFLSATHHDNALSGFDMRFDDGCGCVHYGGEHAVR